MTRTPWHITRTERTLTLSRQLPARFDVAAETTLPLARAGRVAHQVRQDLWRALQRVRGFSPVVEVCKTPSGLHVRAGGRLMGPVAPGLKEQIAAVLEDPEKRARWLRHARVQAKRQECLNSGQNDALLHKCAAKFDNGSESAA
ncbi:hypothetical protein [Roseobacter sp. SK209-2-6]|uniref:hypothetical protein n=1 Tax=Roseobacter sp. SK209-2-6 TaxID=388739 RepID=UPI0005685973|nr:hypothetical protein [Roseobacter sp. SK209-2-6]